MDSPSRSDGSHTPLPASAQIALALVVLKSKPVDASIEDHLTQLRDRIVVGCCSTRSLTSQRLDGAAYWKKVGEKAEEEKAALLDKLYDLEKQKKANALISSPATTSPLTNEGKRKREDTPAAKANSRSKRRANPSKAPQSSAKDEISTRGTEALLADEICDAPTNLLQAFFTLRMHLKSQPPVLSAVQVSARRLCHNVSAIIKNVWNATNLNKTSNDGHAHVCKAIRRTYHTVLDAMELLQAQSQDVGGAKALVSELAKTFSEMLRRLQCLAIREQPRTRRVRTRTDSRDENNQILELTNLTARMLTDLDLTKPVHRELFDGLLCTFFDYLGPNLSLAVFSDPITQGLPQTPGLLEPRGLSTGPGDVTQVDLSGTLKVAPYLITILRKVKPRMNERGNMDSEGCAGAVVDKMQNTLLRGLFGKHDLAFSDTLRLPAEVESLEDEGESIVDGEEDTTPEWFIGEIWNNVGWDILTKHVS